MLIEFKFKNFRSFLGEQTFGFSTSPDRAHASTHVMETGMKAVPRIAKTAIVFGPNGGGKSNLLTALATFRDLILHSSGYSDVQFADRYTPFRFGPSLTEPTEFQIDVLLEGVRYRYAIAYDAQRIRAERLLVYRTGKSQRWFERRFDPAAGRELWAPFSPSLNGPREMWRKATRPKALFLTTAAQLNSVQLAPLIHWAEHSLEILFPGDMSDVNRIASGLQDDATRARIVGLLNAVDIHVKDMRVAEGNPSRAEPAPSPGAALRPGARRSIEFLHAREGMAPLWLDSIFEAAGTQRLLALCGPLLQAVEQGKLLLIDEFDASLHPLVGRFLVRLVNDPLISDKGAQLLVTSHNTTLMDLNILRRDEIWLVQLDDRNAGSLMPLLQSSPRKHELIAKNYLNGRYGAVPHIRSRA